MANKNIFQSLRGALLPAATVRNDAGAPAYELSPKATLARLAATGCLTRTFYATAETQLDRVLDLAKSVGVRRRLDPKVISMKRELQEDYIKYMNKFVDWEVESKIGYFPRKVEGGDS